MKKNALAFPLLILFALPLLASLFFMADGMLNFDAWAALFAHPQLSPALKLSIFTGLASTVLSLLVALIIVAGLYSTSWWPKLSAQMGAMLAMPHLAMAIGLSFLIMPSGNIARALAVFTGWQSPPDWITNHDPYGLSLIASLVVKEIPFFVWILASILNREDESRNFSNYRVAALSLGHNLQSIWLRIFLPQIMPKLFWPLLIVFAYSATVVDMAIVIGPTQPPTLASIVWSDINDADVANNVRGSVGAVLMSLAVVAVAILVWGFAKTLALKRAWLTNGPKANRNSYSASARLSLLTVIFIYMLTTATLLLLSFAAFWPFPNLWPQNLSGAAWLRVWENPSAILTSLALAFSTTSTALALVIAWMESQPQSRDKTILLFSAVALGLPAILLSLGQYRAFLQLGLTGTASGLFLAHLVPVTAYVFIVLAGPYRSFDRRWQSSASGLLVGFPRFLWAIKLPLLKAPLWAASAIGFAVSFSQYVPAQLMSAGRFSTLPMEAVTLTSGTNRPLTAAFALLLTGPPLVAFISAAYFSKTRWRTK